MAWVDDRLWCHPKVLPLSLSARWVYVAGICYASGMNTKGVLDRATQKLLGGNARVKVELVTAGLWDELTDGRVYIHDWEEHNGKRDQRKAKEAARVKEWRRRQRDSE